MNSAKHLCKKVINQNLFISVCNLSGVVLMRDFYLFFFCRCGVFSLSSRVLRGNNLLIISCCLKAPRKKAIEPRALIFHSGIVEMRICRRTKSVISLKKIPSIDVAINFSSRFQHRAKR
jgi:hypothetical protein